MAFKLIGNILLVYPAAEIMGIKITVSMSHFMGAAVMSILQIVGNRPVRPGLHLSQGIIDAH